MAVQPDRGTPNGRFLPALRWSPPSQKNPTKGVLRVECGVMILHGTERKVILPIFLGIRPLRRRGCRRWRVVGRWRLAMVRGGSITQVEIDFIVIIIDFLIVIHIRISAILLGIIVVIVCRISCIGRQSRSRCCLAWYFGSFGSRLVVIVAAPKSVQPCAWVRGESYRSAKRSSSKFS